METRYCNTHSDQSYSLACKKCFGVYCLFCSHWESHQCKDGSHRMIALDTLVSNLLTLINEKKVRIFEKEETILGIVKELTRVISDWDTDTEEMIQLIHQARDKQIEELTAKYEALEKRLTEMRRNAMTEVSQYLDGDIGTKLNKLTREIRRLDTRIYTNHKAIDVISRYKETERLCDELMQMKVPVYKQSENHVIVSITASCMVAIFLNVFFKVDVISRYKETERLCDELMQMKVPVYKPSVNHLTVSVSSDVKKDYEINAQILQWTPPIPIPLPTSLKLFMKVQVSGFPNAIAHHHQQFTYVGLQDKTIERIADGSKTAEQFLLGLTYGASGVVIHKDLIYVLGYYTNAPPQIQVYNLTGTLVRRWSCGSTTYPHYNKMCIVNDEIVVCNKTNKCLTVYSLTGGFIKEISCENINNKVVCMASGPQNSTIVSDQGASSVFRVDIETGNVMWTSKLVWVPLEVTCYGEQFVLAANRTGDGRIWILDAGSGTQHNKDFRPKRSLSVTIVEKMQTGKL